MSSSKNNSDKSAGSSSADNKNTPEEPGELRVDSGAKRQLTMRGLGAISRKKKELAASDKKRGPSFKLPLPKPPKLGGRAEEEQQKLGLDAATDAESLELGAESLEEVSAESLDEISVESLEEISVESLEEISAESLEEISVESLEEISVEALQEVPLSSPPPAGADADDFAGEATTVSPSPLSTFQDEPALELAPQKPEISSTAAQYSQREDDFQAKKTEVFQSPYQYEALAARLSALSGPAAGQEFLLNRQRNTIGRGANNTILVPDVAMSRQHLEILQDAEHGYLLVDVRSANGTRLNHTIIEEAELRHGDRIEAGASEFQFVLPGARPAARAERRHIVVKQAKPMRPAPAPNHPDYIEQSSARLDKTLTWVIFGASALSLVLLIVMAALLFSPPQQEQHADSADPELTIYSPLQSLYLQGVEAVKDRDWDKAARIFSEVQQKDPSFSDVSAQLARASREQGVQRELEQARAMLQEKTYAEASELAGRVTRSSVYYEDAQVLLREARRLEHAELFERAQEAVEQENPEQARQLIATILDAVPGHKGALKLGESLGDDKGNSAEERALSAPSNAPSARAGAARAARPGSAQPGGAAPTQGRGQVSFTRGFTLYKAGDFSEAIAYFREIAAEASAPMASRAEDIAARIEEFSQEYARAQRALERRDWPGAVDLLTRAQQIDRQIAATAYFKRASDDKLAEAHAQIGLAALAQKKYDTASQHYQHAEKYNPDNSTLKNLSAELEKESQRD